MTTTANNSNSNSNSNSSNNNNNGHPAIHVDFDICHKDGAITVLLRESPRHMLTAPREERENVDIDGDDGDHGLYTTSVMPFVCQRCRQSVHIMAAYLLRGSSGSGSGENYKKKTSEKFDGIPVLRSGVEVERAVFDLFTKASQGAVVDFMLCMECTDVIEKQLQKELQMKTEEADTLARRKDILAQQFASFATEIDGSNHNSDSNNNNNNGGSGSGSSSSGMSGDGYDTGDEQAMQDEKRNMLEMVLQQEQELLQELNRLGSQYEMINTEHSQVDMLADILSRQRTRYWSHWNDYVYELDDFISQWVSTEQLLSNQSKDLQRLNTTNVFNDAFHIWFEGFFGTINGLRMGKLGSTAFHQPVDWNETNAAWGMACMLLSAIEKRLQRQQYDKNRDAARDNGQSSSEGAAVGPSNGSESDDSRRNTKPNGSIGFHFTKYRPVPMGSFSRIEMIDGNTGWDLIGGGGGMFWQSKYDKALIGFLHCLKELGDYASRQSDNQFHFLYQITEPDRIDGLTIKFSSSSDENWTRACKYVLINLKYLVVWCSVM